MRKEIIRLAALVIGVMLAVFILPGVSAETLFSDDFSGDLSQWNMTIYPGNYTIENGYMKSAVGAVTEARSFVTFDETEYLEYSFKMFANGTATTSYVEFFVSTVSEGASTNNNVRVITKLGSGPGGNRVQLYVNTNSSNVKLYEDFNYSYEADEVWYNFKLYINGTDAKFKVWNESDSEPDWRWEGSHGGANLAIGYKIRVYSGSLSGSEYVGYDDILLTSSPPVPPTPTTLEQYPILAVIPIVIVAFLLLGIVGMITSGDIDVRLLITLAIATMVAIVMVGVMYVV